MGCPAAQLGPLGGPLRASAWTARPPPTPLAQLCPSVAASGAHAVFTPAALDTCRVGLPTGGTLLAPGGGPRGTRWSNRGRAPP